MLVPKQKTIKIVKASAGSGKTFSLTAHYLSLLFNENVRFSQILAVTFTNKATAEMKSRILGVLHSLATGEKSADSYIPFILEVNPSLDHSGIKPKAIGLYRAILHDYSRFAVSTIDGFMQKIIRSFTFELGIASGYKLEMNIPKVKKWLASKLHVLLDQRPDLLDWIIANAEKQIAKDKNWNYRNALIDLASEIFKENFEAFNEAFQLMSEADKNQVFETVSELNQTIIDGFEAENKKYGDLARSAFSKVGLENEQFLGKSRNYLTKLGSLEENQEIDITKLEKYINNPEQWQRGELQGEMEQLYKQLNPILNAWLHYTQTESPLYHLAIAIDGNFYYLRLLKEMSILLADYREENTALLISDAQVLLKNLTKIAGNSSFIWEKMGNRFNFFLFDEFQDTSGNQWANLLPLLQNALASPQLHFPEHLIVGDVKQSIYRWRNSDWAILHMKAGIDLGSETIQEETLSENYRSHEQVVLFNNFLFKYAPAILQEAINKKVKEQLRDEHYKRWWQDSGKDTIMVDAYSGHEQAMPKNRQKTNGKVTVDFIPVESNHTWARNQHTQSAAMEKMGTQIKAWITNEKYKAAEIGILVRTNKEARLIVDYLLSLQQSLPPQLRFGVLSGEALILANNLGIRLLINTLKAMVSNAQNATLYKANSIYLFQQISGKAVLEGDVWMAVAKTPIQMLSAYLPQQLCEKWEVWQQMPLAELIELLIETYRLGDYETHLPYLLAFRDLVANFSTQGEKGVQAFLLYWEEDGIKKTLPDLDSENAIEVITIHKSKGLAFEVVMIPFCSWSLDANSQSNFWIPTVDTPYALLNAVPVRYSSTVGKSVLFERFFSEMLNNHMDALNLLYVATTRTIRELYIIAPGIKGDKENYNLIADVLLFTLKYYSYELNIEFSENISFPFQTTAQANDDQLFSSYMDKRKSVHSWSFTSYPIAHHLQRVLENDRIRQDLLSVEINNAQRMGLLIHDLLSRTTEQVEIDYALLQMQQEGLITFDDMGNIKQHVLQFLAHPQLAELLQLPYRHVNEQCIIDIDGAILRPDKVLIGPEETIVLDFKFTAFQKQDHRLQIRKYQQLLLEMGYPKVKAYLFYALIESPQLIAV